MQEWCNSTLGQALRSWLLHKRESREPLIDLLLGLLIDVASGVGYLHDKNIIHGGAWRCLAGWMCTCCTRACLTSCSVAVFCAGLTARVKP